MESRQRQGLSTINQKAINPIQAQRAGTVRQLRVASGELRGSRQRQGPLHPQPKSLTPFPGPTGRDRTAQGEGSNDRSPGFGPDWSQALTGRDNR